MDQGLNAKDISYIPKNRIFLVCLVLFVLILAFFNDVFFGGKTLKGSVTIAQALNTGPYGQENNRLSYIPYIANDPAVLEEPYLEFKKNTILRGIFPFWNPHQACGMPFFANGQPAVLFPLSAILYFISDKYSWDMYIILQIFLAGLFTYYFMRLIGYLAVPSILAATAYMFSGPIITWMVNVTTSTSILLPLLFICVEKIIRRHDIKWAAISSIVIGGIIISGHPEHVFFAFLTSALYFLLRIICAKPEEGIDRLKIFKLIFIALILGLLLSSIFVFPLMEFVAHGWTSHGNSVGATSEELPSKAITLIVPYFFQKVIMTLDYERAGWFGGYIGVMTLLLALIGAFKKDRFRNNVIFASLAFFILSKCYGLPPVNWVGHLPVFSKMRYSLHYTQDFAFAMAVLAGIGLNRLIESKKQSREMALSALFVGAVIVGFLGYHGNKPAMAQSTIYAFILLALFVSAGFFIRSKKILPVFIVLLLAAELFYLMPKEHAKKYNSFPKTPYIEFLKEQKPRARSFGILWTFFPNTATAYGIDDLGVYEGLLNRRFVEYTRKFLDPDGFRTGNFVPALRTWLPDLGSPFLDLLNVAYIVAPVDPKVRDYMGSMALETVYSGEVDIYKRPNAFPRSFVTHRVLFGKDEKEVVELMKKNARDLRNIAIVEGKDDRGIEDILRTAPLSDTSTVEIKKYTPNYISIEASLDYPGILILSDTYYPGWKAYVDGRRAELYNADLLLRAVFVDAGKHTVEFRYEPASFMAGALISIGTVILLIAGSVFISFRRRLIRI